MSKLRVYIGSNLKKLRKERNMKQKDVADYIGISIAVYSSYETDKREPTLSVVIALAELFQTSTDTILGL